MTGIGVGIGVDIVDLPSFAEALARTPGLLDRLFAPGELDGLALESIAARFAAKEALAKALGAPAGLAWRDAVVAADAAGRPCFELAGSVADAARQLGVTGVQLSLTHDGPVAVAFVVLQGQVVGSGQRTWR